MADAPPDESARRIIPAWRLVVGAYLHFVLPAYLIAVPVAAIFASPAHASVATMVAVVPELSGWFLGGYALLAAGSVVAAMAVEPLLRSRAARRAARDPHRAQAMSRRRVSYAVTEGAARLGAASAVLLDGLRGARWDHSDERFQALSADLAEVVRTASAALASAPAERRAAIMEVTATSLRRIEAGLVALQAESGRLDEGDLHTVARYVATRYGHSDFAGGDR